MGVEELGGEALEVLIGVDGADGVGEDGGEGCGEDGAEEPEEEEGEVHGESWGGLLGVVGTGRCLWGVPWGSVGREGFGLYIHKSACGGGECLARTDLRDHK